MGNSVVGAASTNIQQVSLTQSTMKVRQDIDVVFSFFTDEREHDKFKTKCTNRKKYNFDTGLNGNNDYLYPVCRSPLRYFISKDIRKKKNQRLMMVLSLGAKSLDDNRYKEYSASFKEAIALINNHRSEIESDFRCEEKISINPRRQNYTDLVRKTTHDDIQEYEKDMANDIVEIYDFFYGELEKLKSWIKNIRSYIGYDPSLVDIHVHIETLLPFFSFAFELKKQCTEQNIAIIDSIDVYEPPRSIQFELERYNLADTYTEGRLYVKGQYNSDSPWYLCDTLEDKDRGLKDNFGGLNGYDINKAIKPGTDSGTKNHGITAIPRGTYGISSQKSDKFCSKLLYSTYYNVYELNDWKEKMPNIVFSNDVFNGVLFHYGATASKSEGCILIGEKNIDGELKYKESFKYWVRFMNVLQPALDNDFELSLSILLKGNAPLVNISGKNDDIDITTFLDSVQENRPQRVIAENFQRVTEGEEYKKNKNDLQAELDRVFGQAINYQDSEH